MDKGFPTNSSPNTSLKFKSKLKYNKQIKWNTCFKIQLKC